MKIIIEGPDNSGKSTLAKKLSDLLRLPLYVGKGPVKSPLDFYARWMEFVSQEDGVYDRHFCISELIYQQFFDRGGKMHDDALVQSFYRDHNPIIIYARPLNASLDGHTATSPADTPEYLAALSHQHSHICAAYDLWAATCSPILYTIGMPLGELLIQLEHRLDNQRSAA
ncbi:MAG: hypothetical protein E6R03_01065 [Hyphomicrobiaceae bacterium]|nr:MAG: hypothetical protein E6R03_01065 [Hyphomicrobiaceae bacterium]